MLVVEHGPAGGVVLRGVLGRDGQLTVLALGDRNLYLLIGGVVYDRLVGAANLLDLVGML